MGKKLGMKREVDLWGTIYPVTLVQLQDNEILEVKNGVAHQKENEDDLITLKVGAGLRKWKNLTRAEMGTLPTLSFLTS
jgi:ribosomal protein L3